MADLSFKEASQAVQLVGGDELHAADVIEEFGQYKLRIKGEAEISSALNIFSSSAIVSLADNVETTLVNSGPGTVSGLVLRFSKDDVLIKLVIDGNTIFEINTQSLKDVVDWDNAAQPNTYVSVNSNRRTFYFTPNFPVKANISIVLSVQPMSGGTNIIGQVRQFS